MNESSLRIHPSAVVLGRLDGRDIHIGPLACVSEGAVIEDGVRLARRRSSLPGFASARAPGSRQVPSSREMCRPTPWCRGIPR